MDILPDEQRLLAIYRRLTPAGRQELLAYAAGLAHHEPAEPAAPSTSQQCSIEKKDERPETVKEPVFTE